jgi:hypothetical protein
MKCPISAKIDYEQAGKLHTNYQECLKGECAWWHTFKDEGGTTRAACAIIHIADALKSL